MGLRVLITNLFLRARTGTELYVRDLALELHRQGHEAAVFTSVRGEPARELEAAGIQVTCGLREARFPPDVIHGHHYPLALRALYHFPAAPAIYVCHDHTYRLDRPPFHPRVRRYFGVSLACVNRLRGEGVPEGEALLLPNFVDLKRFQPRSPLPTRPLRALVFSNYAHSGTHLPAVEEACRLAGLKFDVIGERAGNPSDRPEDLLGGYDLVFAKGRAALEAMAVGAAVVLCDFSGAGPMVTSDEFESLRPLNFGFLALSGPLEPGYILRQITRYDARDAAKVRDVVRSTCGLEEAVGKLVGIYREVIEEHGSLPPVRKGRVDVLAGLSLFRDELGLRLLSRWWSLDGRRRGTISRVPLVGPLKTTIEKAFFSPGRANTSRRERRP
jgi:hypothetical protein